MSDLPDDPCATAASVSLEDWRFDTEGSLTHALCGSVYEVPPCSLTRLLALTEQHVCPVTATSQNAPSDATLDTAAQRRPVTHDVKCWPVYFERVLDGSKTFEVRLNDRDYQEGDRIVLNEWDPDTGHYTNRRVDAVIGYVLRESCAAIPDFADHVVFSLHKVRTRWAK